MKTLILFLSIGLPEITRAELPPELHHLKECQSQAAIPLVFNSDRYLIKWHKAAETTERFISKARDRCSEIRKKFPGEDNRISTLKMERADLVREVKKKTLKQEELVKYIGDLRKDMEKFGGPETKACVEKLKKVEKSLPNFAEALEKDAASICED